MIQNPVPTPEQMANLLGVSPARVATLRTIMRSGVRPVPSYRAEKSRKKGVNKTASTPRQFKTRRKINLSVKAAAY